MADDIGSTLREARMRARIDISEVEARTKIRAKYLRAIENEEWDLLPGSVYAKSFLRTYGDFLGLDSRMLVDEFKRRYEDRGDHDNQPIAALAREPERPSRFSGFPSWVPIALAVAALVGILYVVGSATQSGSGTPSTRRPVATHPSSHPKPHKPPPAPKPTTANLQLVPTGTVYVCLVNGAGQKLINEQTYSPGQAIPTEKAPKLLLTLGNNGVQMKVNGKPVTVPASPDAIRLLITPSSVAPIPLSQAPTCP
jgi:cytoskeleton protein RodZ